MMIFKSRLAADNCHTRIEVQTGRRHLHAHITNIKFAGPALQLAAERQDNVSSNKVMSSADAGHGKNFTVEVFTLVIGHSLEGEVLCLSNERLDLPRH